jgi:hypothetical protein
MTVGQINAVLKLYGLMVKRERASAKRLKSYRWHLASIHVNPHGVRLWTQLYIHHLENNTNVFKYLMENIEKWQVP